MDSSGKAIMGLLVLALPLVVIGAAWGGLAGAASVVAALIALLVVMPYLGGVVRARRLIAAQARAATLELEDRFARAGLDPRDQGPRATALRAALLEERSAQLHEQLELLGLLDEHEDDAPARYKPRRAWGEDMLPNLFAIGVFCAGLLALLWGPLSSSTASRSALAQAPALLGIALALGLGVGYIALSIYSAATVARQLDHSARRAHLAREVSRVELSQQELRGALTLAASSGAGELEVAGQRGQIEEVRA